MGEHHQEPIIYWARFVKEHPEEWKHHLTKFVNAIFAKQREVDVRLASTPKGREKLARLVGLHKEIKPAKAAETHKNNV